MCAPKGANDTRSARAEAKNCCCNVHAQESTAKQARRFPKRKRFCTSRVLRGKGRTVTETADELFDQAVCVSNAPKWTRAQRTLEATRHDRIFKEKKVTSRKPRARSQEQRTAIALVRRPSDGRVPGTNPRTPCAFKVSMFNVFCNSH